MKYTELKVKILSGYLTCQDVVDMGPKDFLSENEKFLLEQA